MFSGFSFRNSYDKFYIQYSMTTISQLRPIKYIYKCSLSSINCRNEFFFDNINISFNGISWSFLFCITIVNICYLNYMQHKIHIYNTFLQICEQLLVVISHQSPGSTRSKWKKYYRLVRQYFRRKKKRCLRFLFVKK